ncbi:MULTISPECIES: helix-turn-helix transcriptional regulator [Streptomyces]|uniref:AraC family transcriptional regulator n=1 Tax=Streptomyces ardesiacus TaxID=285564 RepID=A0ABW8H1T2_9ACTN|nr:MULTISPECIES: AraC family transcriptional regulator [Streptomyces]NEB63423.1 AraC family transcriptional regulator [Streptomyces diastaticus]KOT94633.1 transcriptional regulator [Streptomyces sp. NRRL F-4711]KOX28113.1 transcriptional regulator [Streptomyces sp. NRRL F-4707]KOX43879.1 transcriptional regulator [Streptomyces sp. NRRL F-7442]MCL7367178.1 AraC family transcriptional regulator [Streptomyces ardesiacus]
MADEHHQDGEGGRGADGGSGEGIRTFPFPVDLSLLGVGMQVGPMGAGRTWHAHAPLHRVHRIDFHTVMLFTGGPVRHMIDFAEYEASAGDLLWIRPGQVHRFAPEGEYRGTVLTMQPGFLPRATVEATGLYRYDLPPLLHPDEARLAGLTAALGQLRREYEDATTLPLSLHTAVLRHTLSAFLLRLAHLAAGSAREGRTDAPGDSTFTLFRDAVERGFATNHSVSAYADALGYSRRTLVRAVRAATGETPKGFIDKRVVLEAKRLLAHTDLPIGRVGAAVGFPDAANFSKFFQQHTDQTPAAFRAELR